MKKEMYCPHCEMPCESQNGFSSCCNSLINLPEEPALVEGEDPTGTGLRRRVSRYVGLTLEKGGRWRASVTVHGRVYFLGRYPEEATAARVFDNAAYYLDAAALRTLTALNFPSHYADGNAPAQFIRTRRLVGALTAARRNVEKFAP